MSATDKMKAVLQKYAASHHDKLMTRWAKGADEFEGEGRNYHETHDINTSEYEANLHIEISGVNAWTLEFGKGHFKPITIMNPNLAGRYTTVGSYKRASYHYEGNKPVKGDKYEVKSYRRAVSKYTKNSKSYLITQGKPHKEVGVADWFTKTATFAKYVGNCTRDASDLSRYYRYRMYGPAGRSTREPIILNMLLWRGGVDEGKEKPKGFWRRPLDYMKDKKVWSHDAKYIIAKTYGFSWRRDGTIKFITGNNRFNPAPVSGQGIKTNNGNLLKSLADCVAKDFLVELSGKIKG